MDSNGKLKSPRSQEISYAVGDKIELRCNSAPSKPAARLRWYLNDHELTAPSANTRRARRAASSASTSYDVRVTPIEYRQHYKGIYSSHSNLTLVLQQDDLINNRISFKCLAAMRQDVAVRSKQLIVQMPPHLPNSVFDNRGGSSSSRSARAMSEFIAAAKPLLMAQRHKRHLQRHSVSRMGDTKAPQADLARLLHDQAAEMLDQPPLYIYEDANAKLGGLITETYEFLAEYLRQKEAARNSSIYVSAESYLTPSRVHNAPHYDNRNLEYIQIMRELTSPPAKPIHKPVTTFGSGGSRRFGASSMSSLVRSPYYADEHSPVRPVLSWPPLAMGRLNPVVGEPKSCRKLSLLASPVASPLDLLLGRVSSNESAGRAPRTLDGTACLLGAASGGIDSAPSTFDQIAREHPKLRLIQLMLPHINCTSVDNSIDTRLEFLVNDELVSSLDTVAYAHPKMASPNELSLHKQAAAAAAAHSNVLTIGFQSSVGSTDRLHFSHSQTLSPDNANTPAQHRASMLLPLLQNKYAASPKSAAGLAADSMLQLACQATHSMLLYSSSEMVTFDFNPLPDASPNSQTPSERLGAVSQVASSSAAFANRSQLLAAAMSLLCALAILQRPNIHLTSTEAL